jgi:hypothetical protein
MVNFDDKTGSALHDKRGLEPLDLDTPRCYKIPMKFLLKTSLFSLFNVFLWVSAFAASGPIIVNVDVPSGQWKAARLKNLPKDAMVAVKVESNGEVMVALVHAKAFQNSPDSSRPLFAGRVERRLSFSVAIAEKGQALKMNDESFHGASERRKTRKHEKARGYFLHFCLEDFELSWHWV